MSLLVVATMGHGCQNPSLARIGQTATSLRARESSGCGGP